MNVEEVPVAQSTIFKSNKSQAVRLPKPVALPDGIRKVEIIKLGRARLIVPAGESWDVWFERKGASEDFLSDREQPEHQEREPLE